MRNTFSRALVLAAKRDPKLVLMTGDHGYSLFDDIRKTCPNQYLNVGVAEQNMVGMAAGLAKAGFHPIVYGLSAFVPIRVLEQIKLDVCYENLPVIFVGDGAGVVYSTLGASHQSAEDIAALRAVPNICILSPADEHEMVTCLKLAFDCKGPAYLRIGKSDLGTFHSNPPALKLGELACLKAGGNQSAWIATGSMVAAALAVSKNWKGSSVYSAPTIKPLNESSVLEICKNHKSVIVLEEHSIYGGLGSAIAEIASLSHPTPICRIGIQDKFSKFCGSYQYLISEHQLDPQSIQLQVEHFQQQIQ